MQLSAPTAASSSTATRGTNTAAQHKTTSGRGAITKQGTNGNAITHQNEMDNIRHEKVQKFEEFVDGRLKPDLVRAIAERDKVFEQQKVFSDLRRNIKNLEKNSVTSIRTMVNLGSEVYMQADVPDTQHIFVDVGLGFHVEFTWSEALSFISLREEKLARQIEEYTRLIASIKAQIKLVCEGIRELLQIPAEKPVQERTF
ncbi:Prefoldin domain-containing protein [Cephalotus follicularis]|uniref:Prefoldin domain-containing protein n=1 Tax=Cephalotus follicularis TaxID=3775 RepID=A0A1Q3ARQ0_CEPFO|nr:Prefoldin domain-containing protein [Cephalotus follicularis]